MKLRYLVPLSALALATACGGGDDTGSADDESTTGDGDSTGDGDPGDGDSTGDGDDTIGGMGGGDGSSDNGNTDAEIVAAPSDADCDLSGVWAVEANTHTTADLPTGGTQDQRAKRWYLYEISHDGDDVEIVRSLNCQVHVEGGTGLTGVTVTLEDTSTSSILERNSHAGMKGTYTKSGEVCELDLDRGYSVLGVNKGTYLPADASARPELSELTPLPTEGATDGAEDWDGDGDPGIAFTVDAFLPGTRNSAQRSYFEFDSDSTNEDYTIALSASTFTVNNLTSIEEQVLSADNDLLKTAATLSGTDHPVTFTRLGDNRATATLPGDATIPEDDLEACKALQTAFPY